MSDLNDNQLMRKDESQQKFKTVRKEGEPTAAFKGASWATLVIGMAAYLIGLFNADMELNEKGYYFAVLIFGLYAAVSLQKAVRDKEEDIPVSSIYYGISWFAVIIAVALMAIGLYNADGLALSEKGFYSMAFVLSLFSAITIQKNIRDTQVAKEKE
ncbi:hypothetical protein A374_07116 [Fictibacillus macauensis ZFHKF-1]|uniref:YiaAB two helix domain-containing protein n=1 Tax=Fictibacillus macauensis ZFHKF-1 TaxID=1196324 RepID=I8J2U6_9BACL|nr:inner membrane protein YiaA [Fictibacillus macauensis]EIT86071.1 hypothetical protein A374_07116 [Fictibacillus macauensis ZFHKF-1]